MRDKERYFDMNSSRIDLIAIGGSWGGMDAVISILNGLPADFPVPVAIVLHRHKSMVSSLVEIFARNLTLHVKEVDEKEKIEAGIVYIAPRNYHILIEKNRSFSLCVSEEVHYARPSIDVFFESAAGIYKKRLLGILLTGANADGSEGLKAIADNGGTTIVQDPEDAESPYMPESALKIMTPDFIYTRKEINVFLKKL
jgi:two-component system chemotaxis response regulator CheB